MRRRVPARSDIRVAMVAAVSQMLFWLVVGPGLVAMPGACAVVVAAVLTLVYRRTAPAAALAGATVATGLGISGLGVAVASAAPIGPAAVVVTAYALAVHRTAAVSAAGVTAAAVGLAGAVAARGASARTAVAAGFLLGAVAAGVWAVGRLRRRVRADRAAAMAFRDAADRFAALAVARERRRFAAELHDVAGHRLTAILVSADAALRLADPSLRERAVAHAIGAGQAAVDDLDQLAAAADCEVGIAAVDELVAAHPCIRYERTARSVPPAVAAVAHRIVREALTNIMRYAHGAPVTVRIDHDCGMFTVTVRDGGGSHAAGQVGSGLGIAGLRGQVEAFGGTLEAGPAGPGWRLRARLPWTAPDDPSGTGAAPGARMRTWVGAAVRDRAMVVLTLGLSTGTVLLPGGDSPDPLVPPVPAVLLVTMLVLHALPVGWRRLAPVPALTAALTIQAAWLAGTAAGWTRHDPAETFLWCWWVELALVYAVGAHRPATRLGFAAPLAVAAVGGVTLGAGPGITGNRAAAAVLLGVLLAVPLSLAWTAGRAVAAQRSRKSSGEAAARDIVDRHAEEAARRERTRILAGLRGSVRQHATSALAAAQAGRLDEVAAQARAGLIALRGLLHGLPQDPPEPPPAVAALADLASRRCAALRFVGEQRPLPVPVEAAAHGVGAVLIADGASVTVTFAAGGLGLEVYRQPPVAAVVLRSVRESADAAGGSVTVGTDRTTVRVWLPEALR
ncbi:ATP-binding protein [Actinoplanes sp. NPDC020271]|uniref:sensor histidine kinase n=1 Tax=Actinoplanes sp. NPDC020271 TaxID=3363896 RepID=UPI00378BFAFB